MCDLHVLLVSSGCYASVITQRTEEKEDLEAGVQGKEPFSACNREQLWKKSLWQGQRQSQGQEADTFV